MKVKDGVMALMGDAIGQIGDISMSGLSFTYLDGSYRVSSNGIVSLVDINDGICIDSLPVVIVQDRSARPSLGFSFVIMRHCSMKFYDLSQQQLKELDEFVSKNIVHISQ
ncbi:MAG: hypothetical protein KAR13_04490 [Desulfobulbaceae bacterium]|nr:hypothetical protein [Desulfobulbaceae bacterium]MCK5543617.1 hypothetical protein [Desulfobulbaceae bacterium]